MRNRRSRGLMPLFRPPAGLWPIMGLGLDIQVLSNCLFFAFYTRLSPFINFQLGGKPSGWKVEPKKLGQLFLPTRWSGWSCFSLGSVPPGVSPEADVLLGSVWETQGKRKKGNGASSLGFLYPCAQATKQLIQQIIGICVPR